MTTQPVPRTDFIAAMRGVASSVSVVTTDGPSGRHGTTVSAFCSVSADPPTVLVCLNATSRIAAHVVEKKSFHVNVLPEDARLLADRFAGLHDSDVTDRFDGIATTMPACLDRAIVLSCMLDQSVAAGSHLICIGQVTAITGTKTRPLTYLDGAYHQITPLNGATA